MSHNRALLVTEENKLSLVDFPRDVVLQPIARGNKLSLRDMASLSNSCKTLHRFFTPTLLRIGAHKLLRAIMVCDYATIKKLTASNPDMMFTFAKYIDINGSEINMCPLAYALRTRAWYAMQIFKAALVTDKQNENFTNWCAAYFPEPVRYDRKAPLFSQDELKQAQPFLDLVSTWLNDENAVTIHDLICFLYEKSISLSTPSCYSLQPGFWAYLAFERLLKAFSNKINPDVIRKDQISLFINGVVNTALKHLFPREMLRQLLAAQDPDGNFCWSREAGFSETALPETGVYVRNCNDVEAAEYNCIYQNENPYQLHDNEEPIWRGHAPEACVGAMLTYETKMILEVYSILDDLYILRHLAKVREEQCSMLCRPQAENVAVLVNSDDSAEESADSVDSADHSEQGNNRSGCTIL